MCAEERIASFNSFQQVSISSCVSVMSCLMLISHLLRHVCNAGSRDKWNMSQGMSLRDTFHMYCVGGGMLRDVL